MFIKELKPIYESVKSYYKKAYVIETCTEDMDFTTLKLYSYKTHVATIQIRFNDHTLLKEFNVYITHDLNHLTQTTLRHINEFLQQNGFNKQSKKFLLTMYESI